MISNKLILVWREPDTREWIPVGVLYQDKDNRYIFQYLNGVKKSSSFIPFGQMNELGKTYISDDIFPLFKNRLLQKSRPEYSSYLDWLGLDDSMSIFDELSRTNGIRATDSLQLFAIPKYAEDYEIKFFSHGISHLPNSYIERLNALNSGDELFIMKDIQNKVDELALVIRTSEPIEIVGYCPRLYTEDIYKLIKLNGPASVNLTVEKINKEAPLQFRMLCKLKTKWHKGFNPFDGYDFKVLSEDNN